jgi:hypothetical protein
MLVENQVPQSQDNNEVVLAAPILHTALRKVWIHTITEQERGREPGDTDDNESDKDDDRSKKKSGKDLSDPSANGRLKCPFFQRQPEKYTKAARRNRGFADMAKLKDHIKRVHTQPCAVPVAGWR